MSRFISPTAIKVAVVGCLLLLAVWIAAGGLSSRTSSSVQNMASVPQQQQQQQKQVQDPDAPPPDAPPPVETGQPTPIPSPTRPPTSTPRPTIIPMGTPIQLPAPTVSTLAVDAQAGMSQKSTIDRTEAISQFIWAPTGDKLLYLTQPGNLYWCNADGSNTTLLHQYGEASAELEDQQPMTNTLLIYHLGQLQEDGNRAPTHMDVIRFTAGQPPTLEQGPELPHTPHHLRWWSSTRASGWAHTDQVGGDLLITVDQNGNMVNEVNVPYLMFGAVRPGGEWLAYMTDTREWVPIEAGTTHGTVYLLNLTTGQRLQVTASGQGSGVGSWSPDGNWFLMGSNSDAVIVSADGQQWVIIPGGTTDAVWSRDSTHFAYAVVKGQSPDGHIITSWTGETHIVNVPARKVTTSGPDPGAKAADSSGLMWQPKWSPDGSLLTFLSFNPGCAFNCSQLAPALYQMAVGR